MLLFSFAVEKVKVIYQCVTFFTPSFKDIHFTVFAAAFQSLYVLRGNIFSGCLFPFPAWFAFNVFCRSSTPFLPAKRFIRLTGKSRPTYPLHLHRRICLKYAHCHHRNHLYNPHIKRHYPESSPQGLASNLQVTLTTETEFLQLLWR